MRSVIPTEMLWRTLVSLLFAAAALGALPDLATPAPSCDAVQARLDGRGFDALQALWRELGVRSTLFEFKHNPQLRADVQLSVDRTDDTSGYTVIRVQDEKFNQAQLLVFYRSGGVCRYAGSIDIGYWKHRPPRYTLHRRHDGGTWLVAIIEGATGTGFYREIEWWHMVDGRGVRFVLGYSARGHDGPIHSGEATLMRTFDSTARPTPQDEIEVALKATYSGRVGSGGEIHLFETTRSIRYGWDAKRQKLTQQPGRSSASQEYLRWLLADAFDVGAEPVVKGFVVQEFAAVCRLAASGSPEQKAWIEAFTSGLYGSDGERLRKCFQ